MGLTFNSYFSRTVQPHNQANNKQPRHKAKDHQVAIVVYHLVPAPVNNSGQALLCTRGFLHTCTRLTGDQTIPNMYMLYTQTWILVKSTGNLDLTNPPHPTTSSPFTWPETRRPKITRKSSPAFISHVQYKVQHRTRLSLGIWTRKY